eukprot:11286050-Ditylum_brightwellii.AAC.1
MSGLKALFTDLHLFPSDYQGYVTLGDSKTRIKVEGVGDMIITIKGKTIQLTGVLYVPALSKTLFSTLEHGQNTKCLFSIHDGIAELGFPDFTITADVDKEIIVDIIPSKTTDHHKTHYSNKIQLPSNNIHHTQVYLLHDDAIIPQQVTEQVAAYDLYSIEEIVIPAGEQRKINTGINILYPHGCYGNVVSHSGISAKHNLSVPTGTIDRDYTGPIFVLLRNNGKEPF